MRLIFALTIILLFPGIALAQEMYIIETDYNNQDQEPTAPQPKKLNYYVETGFPELPKTPFSLTISDEIIDFGQLSPTNPVTRTNILSVKGNSTPDFVVYAQENRPLTDATSLPAGRQALIPDTVCDRGPCSENSSSDWTNTLSYGFGYRCDILNGEGCPGFNTLSQYKQFADASAEETPSIILTGTGEKENKAVVTYKLNVAGTQGFGNYTNIIYYIATPSY